MTTPITVNQSTTLIQIDTSVFTNSPHIVLLSSLNAPGSMITIRDTTGYAGQTNTIIVSTTQGIAYLDGGGARSNIYTINQPYGFLTITPKTSSLWGVINTFAFPDASASANLNFLNVSSMNISTIGYIQQALISTASISTLCTNNVYIRDNLSVGQSTIAHAGFYVCSIRSLHDIIASSNIYAGSTLSSVMANFTSTLTVPYISTTDVWINGGLQTTSSISTSGPMFVGSSISTTGNLAVGASTFIQGQLTVLQAAFFGSSISTTGALNVGHETILHSTLQVSHDSRMGASLSVMSSLYIQWDVYTTSSILAHSSFSTLHDVNIGRNLSTLGKAFIGQEVYTTSSILTTGSFSTLEDVNVARNVSVLGNLYVKGTVQFDNKAMSFQDIVASSILTQYNISSMSSLIAGGGLYVSQSTILFGTVSTMSNFNIAGLLSTASTIVAGDSLIVAKSGYFGSNISTPSSIGVGGILRVGGGVVLESTLSTFGQAAFFSSVQIQGSLSVMSSIVAACNLYVGNTLSTSNLTLYGSTSISTLAVTNTVNFGLNISSSTLHHGLFSTSGAMNIGGLISTTNALTVGSTINTQFLDVRQTMSVFSNAGFAQDISARGSVFVGMSTLVAGGFWASKSATMADTRYTGAVVMDTTLTVGNGSSQTKLNSLLGVLNTATFSNSIFITTGSTQTQNRISNDTIMKSVAFPLDTNVYGRIFSDTYGSMHITANASFSPFPSMVPDYSGNTGTNASCSIVFRPNGSIGFLSASYPQGTTTVSLGYIFEMLSSGNAIVSGSLIAKGFNFETSSSAAIINLAGGHSNNGTGGSNLIAFGRYFGAGFRHFITSRHTNSVGANTNAIDFWLNNSTFPESSSTAGTGNINTMSVTAAGLGVNCNTPQYGLDVNGDINYTGNLKINGANAVFTPAGINSAGSIGINAALNSSYKLYVNGPTFLNGDVTYNGSLTQNQGTLTNTVIEFVGSTTTGSADGSGSDARFNGITDMICDNSSNIYVTDKNNYTIRKVTPAGVVSLYGGTTGSTGNAQGGPNVGTFGTLSGIWSFLGELFVSDITNKNIRKVTDTNSSILPRSNQFANYSSECVLTGICAGIKNGLTYSYVTDTFNKCIYTFEEYQTQELNTLAGPTPGSPAVPFGDGIEGAAGFANPTDICINPSNSVLYVADQFCIRKIVISTKQVTTLAGANVVSAWQDGTGTAARFTTIRSICIDPTDTYLYITQSNSPAIVRRITISTGVVKTMTLSYSIPNVGAICIDPTNTYLYVSSDDKRIYRINIVASGPSSTFGGNVTVSGDINFTGNLIQNGTTFSGAPAGINSAGNVGINGALNASYALNVNGDIYASGNVTAYSDVRAKENIVTIDSALDKVMALRGVYYTRKDNPGPRHLGVIAQEVEAILPEVVMTDSEGKKSVAYGNIVALLLEGMKEQQEMIKELKSMDIQHHKGES